MENRRLFLVFITCFILNVGVSDCQNFQDIIIKNLLNTFSQQCQVPAWDPATNYIQPQRLKMLLYSQRKFHSYPILEAPARLAKTSKFNPEFTTVIYVNGFRCPPDEKIVSDLAEAFAKHGGINFLQYDFYFYANKQFFQYFELARNTSPLAKYLSDFLLDLTDLGVSRNNIHLIGYSYGGHLAGIAGLNFRQALGKPLFRITALDPTTMCFPEYSNLRLGTRSAQFVDIIQTSVFSSGAEDMAHVNFIVNNIRQPGCENDSIVCVHVRSVQLYIESILNEESLLAVKCSNWNAFSNGRCKNNTISPIGYNSRTDITGNFFIRTGVKPPYGIGVRGLN